MKERHFGSFYHNPTILETDSIGSKWVNTNLTENIFIDIQRNTTSGNSSNTDVSLLG